MHLCPTPLNEIEIWAHRGGGLIPEEVHDIERNTLQSFKFSLDLGVDGFETDICLTKDNEPIIYHPGTIQPDPCSESWTAIQWHQPNIMHLKDLLIFLATNDSISCLLEIKQNSNLLIEKVVAEISSAGLCKRIFLTAPSQQMSLAGLETDGNLLKYAKSIDPQIGIHVIDILPFNILKTVKEFRANIVSFGWLNDSWISRAVFSGFFQHLMERQCWKANQAKIKVLAGITETDDHIEALLKASDGFLNGVITDDPEGAVKFLRM